jgi:hypothetical protein
LIPVRVHYSECNQNPLLRLPAAGDNAGMIEADQTNAEPPKRKPCRFQFRLRTLMIVVTLLAVPLGYVGWQKKIVERRNAWISEHRDCRFISEQDAGGSTLEPDQNPSCIRLWLGDTAWSLIAIPEWQSERVNWQPEEVLKEARVLFPEADAGLEF